MFDGLFKSKFFSKCKSDIKLTRTRIEIIMKKRNATQKYLRSDVAVLLRNGFDSEAFDRTNSWLRPWAEGLLTEMMRSECYELIDQYCEHISKNLSAMNKERECPEECREAAASLMYAAARFADLPELRELRTMFSERYGKSLDYYVNKQFAEKLKSDPPPKHMKLELLQEIAAESGLEWNAKALENKLFNESAYDKNLERKEKDLSLKERRETTINEDRLPRRKEAATDARNDLDPPVRVKDTIRRSAMPKEDNEDEPLKKRLIPPPYTKTAANKAAITSSDDSDSSNDKVEDDDAARAKPMGKSVRTRNTKPSPEVDEKEAAKEINKENVAQGRRILKFFDGGRGGKRDEKMMDKLLRHYSKKNGTNKNGKSEPESKLPPNLRSQEGPTPTRASSLRVENTDSPRKHSRAASFHPDMLNANAHVHPKLPDYDEFVARLAAFRGK